MVNLQNREKRECPLPTPTVCLSCMTHTSQNYRAADEVREGWVVGEWTVSSTPGCVTSFLEARPASLRLGGLGCPHMALPGLPHQPPAACYPHSQPPRSCPALPVCPAHAEPQGHRIVCLSSLVLRDSLGSCLLGRADSKPRQGRGCLCPRVQQSWAWANDMAMCPNVAETPQ